MAAPLVERSGAEGCEEGQLINGAATDHFPYFVHVFSFYHFFFPSVLYLFPLAARRYFPSSLSLVSFRRSVPHWDNKDIIEITIENPSLGFFTFSMITVYFSYLLVLLILRALRTEL